jgi:hypothetical protein
MEADEPYGQNLRVRTIYSGSMWSGGWFWLKPGGTVWA